MQSQVTWLGVELDETQGFIIQVEGELNKVSTIVTGIKNKMKEEVDELAKKVEQLVHSKSRQITVLSYYLVW